MWYEISDYIYGRKSGKDSKVENTINEQSYININPPLKSEIKKEDEVSEARFRGRW